MSGVEVKERYDIMEDTRTVRKAGGVP